MLWIGGLECVAGKAHTAQVRLGTPIFNPTLSALHNITYILANIYSDLVNIKTIRISNN